MRYIFVKKVFVAGTYDIAGEKQAVEEVIRGLNKHFRPIGYEYEFVDWKKCLPGAGRNQNDINKLIDDCDIFICLFWKRYGRQSDENPERSYTEQEFWHAYKLYQQQTALRNVIVYFKNIDVEEKTNDIQKILSFKKEHEDLGLFSEYKDLEEFKSNVDDHLTEILHETIGYKKKLQAPVREIMKEPIIETPALSANFEEPIPQYSIAMDANPCTILVRGDTSVISAHVLWKGMALPQKDIMVRFMVDNANIASFPIASSGKTDGDGIVSVMLRSGSQAGSVKLTAEIVINNQIVCGKAVVNIVEWGSIVGRVLDKQYNGIPNATVKLVAEDGTLYHSPENPQISVSRLEVAEIGTYTFFRVPRGRYKLLAEKCDASNKLHSYYTEVFLDKGLITANIMIPDF